MAQTEGLLLEDPEGTKLLVTRIDDAAFTVAIDLAPGSNAYRMFEDDREKLRSFLRKLVG